jgi:hypothetical protein
MLKGVGGKGSTVFALNDRSNVIPPSCCRELNLGKLPRRIANAGFQIVWRGNCDILLKWQ